MSQVNFTNTTNFCQQILVQFPDGMYVLSLVWKHDSVRPKPFNDKPAYSRLDHLIRRLAKNPELEARYHDVFCEMEKKGSIE